MHWKTVLREKITWLFKVPAEKVGLRWWAYGTLDYQMQKTAISDALQFLIRFGHRLVAIRLQLACGSDSDSVATASPNLIKEINAAGIRTCQLFCSVSGCSTFLTICMPHRFLVFAAVRAVALSGANRDGAPYKIFRGCIPKNLVV